MGKRISPTLVGGFVLGGLALALGAVVVLGSGHFFKEQHLFALYFSSDVNGLKVGAPVKFRGVMIGSVTAVLLSVGAQAEKEAEEYRIPVIIDLETKRLVRHRAVANFDDPARITAAVKRGLRAQLNVESLLTGLLYVDLDFHPDMPAKYYMGADSPYPEIPTVPTKLEQVQTTISDALAQFDKINFQELVSSLTKTANAVTTLANSPKIENAAESLTIAARSM